MSIQFARCVDKHTWCHGFINRTLPNSYQNLSACLYARFEKQLSCLSVCLFLFKEVNNLFKFKTIADFKSPHI